MTKYMLIKKSHPTETIESIMKLPLTAQMKMALDVVDTVCELTFALSDHHEDEDIFVVPVVAKHSTIITPYRATLEVSELGIEVDSATNSIQWYNRVFTLVDVIKNSENKTELYFIELVKGEGVSFTPAPQEVLAITLSEDNKEIEYITRCDHVVYANRVTNEMLKRG